MTEFRPSSILSTPWDFSDALLQPRLSIRARSLLDGELEGQHPRAQDVQVAVYGLVQTARLSLVDQSSLKNWHLISN